MPFFWSFQQIEGVGERKVLTLDGYNAPFGRPRQGAVIEEIIKSRVQTKHIPGLSDAPVRTAFGCNWEPTELHGRWMTKNLVEQGKNANGVADDWTRFVRDQRTVRMSWGPIVSYTAFITELRLGRESKDEIAWRMKIEIDKREDIEKVRKVTVPTSILEDLTAIDRFLAGSLASLAPAIPDLSIDLLDELDGIAGLANEFSAALNKLAGRFDDLERAAFSTIQHFRGAVVGLRTAVLTMQDTIWDAQIDAAAVGIWAPSLVVRTASSELAWIKFQADADNNFSAILATLAEMDRKAELALRSEVSQLITAIEGDTWESLATRSLGDPGRAGDIRALNGGTYGAQPTVAEIYYVP